MVSQDKLFNQLIERLDISENEAKLSVEKIQKFSDKYLEYLQIWLDNKEMPNIEVGGFNYSELIEDFDKSPIEALIFLNWLASDKEIETKSERLLKEGYPKHMIERTIKKIESFDEKIKEHFNIWFNQEKEPEISIEGYSFNDLTTKHQMHPIGAFITLDWLLREPEEAKKSLKQGIK